MYLYYADIIEVGNGQWVLNLNNQRHEEVYHGEFDSFVAAQAYMEDIKSLVHHVNVFFAE